MPKSWIHPEEANEAEYAVNGTSPKKGLLRMKAQSKIQHFLFVIRGGLSPTVADGPYRSQADLVTGIIRAIDKDPELAKPEGDTIHALTLGQGRPQMQDFTGGFMDQLRQLAQGKAPDDPVWLVYAGANVIARNGKDRGTMTGGTRNCRQIEGCGGLQVAVRWPDGGLTWPCTHGMVILPSGRWKIHSTTEIPTDAVARRKRL